jgi:hypothetical protein
MVRTPAGPPDTGRSAPASAAPVRIAQSQSPSPSPSQSQSAPPPSVEVPAAAQTAAVAAGVAQAPVERQPTEVVAAAVSGAPAVQQQPIEQRTIEQRPVEQRPVEQRPVQLAELAPSAALATPGFSIAGAQAQAPTSELSAVIEAPAPAPAPVEEGRASRLADVAATIAAIPETAPPVTRTEAPAKAAPAPAAPVKKAAPAAAKKDPPADPKKAAAAATARKEPAKKPSAPAEPSRHWVQVAGGADKAALPRELARLRTKAPKLLAARGGWTAPLNATNRLLVGPFKSSGEAQAFVNQLKAADLSAFAWTSAAGEKIEKLAAK